MADEAHSNGPVVKILESVITLWLLDYWAGVTHNKVGVKPGEGKGLEFTF